MYCGTHLHAKHKSVINFDLLARKINILIFKTIN